MSLGTLESFDSGSNYKFGDKVLKPNNPRSAFDLSHLNSLTIPNGGQLIPIDLIECLPGDDHEISVRSLIRVLPQRVPLYSRQRLYVYAFYSRCCDLWNNFETFMKKGYTGNVNKTIPTLTLNKNIFSNSQTVISPNSFGDYLGLPIGLRNDKFSGICSALPFMMYLRIYRDYFMNKNYFINDRVILPDDDSRFRLDDDGILLSAKDQDINIRFDISSNYKFGYYNSAYNDVSNMYDTTYNYLNIPLLYHDYPQDRFTSSLPWPQRGEAPTLEFTMKDSIDLYLKTGSGQNISYQLASPKIVSNGPAGKTSAMTNVNSSNTFSILTSGTDSPYITFDNTQVGINKLVAGSNSEIVKSNITLNQIRALAIAQTELEKAARTDGSYAQWGLTFFGEICKNSVEYRPIYIGGTYSNIAFTEVLQNSESGQTPLGTYAGHGISSQTDGYIGKVHCDDYGYIMILACIMPDVYYSQGLEKLWTRSLQSDMYLPERAKLGLTPVLNKELYFSGNSEQDNNLWAYNNPFDEYRYLPNRIHGLIADKTNESFKVYTQARFFNELPNYGREFARADDVRKDYLDAIDEVAYTAQFAFDIRSIRELPYKPVPASII